MSNFLKVIKDAIVEEEKEVKEEADLNTGEVIAQNNGEDSPDYTEPVHKENTETCRSQFEILDDFHNIQTISQYDDGEDSNGYIDTILNENNLDQSNLSDSFPIPVSTQSKEAAMNSFSAFWKEIIEWTEDNDNIKST